MPRARQAAIELSPLQRISSAEARAFNLRQMAASMSNPVARARLLKQAEVWMTAAADETTRLEIGAANAAA